MPFTPLHMGPALLVKAPLQHRFSLLVFGWTQIVMDVQPLLVMLTGAGHMHGWTHSWLGALVLTLPAALSGKYAAEWALRRLPLKADVPRGIGWRVAVFSAAAGTFSHVLLDAFMHADLHPYFPLSDDNELLYRLSIDGLHRLCVYTGVAGTVVWLWLRRRRLVATSRLRSTQGSEER